jgi:hypothetical protein
MRHIALIICVSLLGACNTPKATFLDELHSVEVNLDVRKNPTLHAVFESVETQANSQLPESQKITIRLDIPPVNPPPKQDDAVPSTGGYLRRVSVPDAVKYLAEIADLDFTILEDTRQIVIKEKIQQRP